MIRLRSTLVIGLFLVGIATVTIGMNHGFTADSPADARINPADYDTEVDASDRQYDNPVLPDAMEPEPGARGEYVEGFTESVVEHSLQAASVVSVWTFQNKHWISPWWAEKILSGITLTGIVGYLAITLRDVKRLMEVSA